VSVLLLYDDAAARRFEPFSLTRPVGELRAGAELVRERWERVLGARVAAHLTAPHLCEFTEFDAPGCLTSGVLPAGATVINARCAPALAPAPGAAVMRCNGTVAAVRLREPVDASRFADGALTLDQVAAGSHDVADVPGWWMHHAWDLVRHLAPMLTADIAALAPEIEREAPGALTTIGDHAVVIERGAVIEPFVVFDASAGPVLVRARAQVGAFSRLVGPCVVGRDSIVAGGRIATSSIGEVCRVHGELSTSIFLGHANKAHDGFVGHSVLGRWTNLGASTVTSNLKNTYGTVQTWTPAGDVDTGLQFLGTLMGDHAKTAIGTRLMTGTVIGAGANVVSDTLPPKVIVPFAWGAETYRLDKFLEVAARVMARRHVTLGERERAHLVRVHAARWTVLE
jgi:UDP-N-acetylglucosamine diphosphorylase/glucosamine-1-phosphate N-acetyltransferase